MTRRWKKYDERSIWGDLVRETAAHVEAHRDLFPGVLIGDGFANTIPWPASSREPLGVTAIDKHPYSGRQTFPDPKQRRDIPPLNALFARDDTGWEPTYTSLFPEYFAAVLQTETIIREMSPLTTDVYGVKHGRNARTPPVSTWITEVNMAPDEYLPDADAAAARDLKGKTTARYFTFFLNKGVTLMTLYNDAGGGDKGLALESDVFLTYAQQPDAALPADDGALTSPALRVIGNIAAQMRPGLDPTLTPRTTRRLTLDRIADTHNHFQFAGDGTAAHPPLYDRDVFAFLPFQVNAHTFVIPYYVMTRDVAHVYAPNAAGGHQYDMPAEDFTLTIGGLHGSRARVTAYDPLNDRPVTIKIRRGRPHSGRARPRRRLPVPADCARTLIPFHRPMRPGTGRAPAGRSHATRRGWRRLPRAVGAGGRSRSTGTGPFRAPWPPGPSPATAPRSATGGLPDSDRRSARSVSLSPAPPRSSNTRRRRAALKSSSRKSLPS